MHNIVENYKDAIVNIIGVLGSMAMLTYGFIVYQGLVEQMIAAIFYK